MSVHQDVGVVLTFPTLPPGSTGAGGARVLSSLPTDFELSGSTVYWTRDYQSGATVWTNWSSQAPTILGGAAENLVTSSTSLGKYVEFFVSIGSGTVAESVEDGELTIRVIDGNGVPFSIIAIIGQVGAATGGGSSDSFFKVWDDTANPTNSVPDPIMRFSPKPIGDIDPQYKSGTVRLNSNSVVLPVEDVEPWIYIRTYRNMSSGSNTFGGYSMEYTSSNTTYLYAPISSVDGSLTGPPIYTKDGYWAEPAYRGCVNGDVHLKAGNRSSSDHIYIGDTNYTSASKPDFNTIYYFSVDHDGNASTATPIHNSSSTDAGTYVMAVSTVAFEGDIELTYNTAGLGTTTANIKFSALGEWGTDRWEMPPPTTLQQASGSLSGAAKRYVCLENDQLVIYYYHSGYVFNGLDPWWRTEVPLVNINSGAGGTQTVPQSVVDANTTSFDPWDFLANPPSNSNGYLTGYRPGGKIWTYYDSGDYPTYFIPDDGSTPTSIPLWETGPILSENGFWIENNGSTTSEPIGTSGTTHGLISGSKNYYFYPSDFTPGDNPSGIASISGIGLQNFNLRDYEYISFSNSTLSSTDKIQVRLYGDGPWGTSTRVNSALVPELTFDVGSLSPVTIDGTYGIIKLPSDWSQFDISATPTTTNPVDVIPGLDMPFSLDWPAEMYEGDTVTGLWEVAASGNSIANSVTFEVLDPVSGAWVTTDFDTTDKYGEPDRSGMTIPGVGVVWLEQETDTWPADTSESSIPDALTVEVKFKPDDQYWGTVEFMLRAKGYVQHDPSSYDFSFQTSPAVLVTVDMVNEPDRPRVSGDGFPDTVEEVAVSSSNMAVEDPDNSGSYTWELSGDQKPEFWEEGDPDFRTNTSTTSVTVTDDDGYTAGTIAITSQSGTSVSLTFTPAQYWNGQAEGWLRVDNNTGADKSRWRRLPVNVEAVENQPTAPTPTAFGTFNEDTVQDLSISWTDPDVGTGSRKGTYQAELRLTGDSYWFGLQAGEIVDLGDIRVRLTAFDSDAMTATLRAEPKANWNGDFDFDFRLKDTSGGADDVLYSPVAVFTGTVSSRPDTPTLVVPSRMPRCKPGGVAFGRFSTFDPDTEDTFWRFEISTTGNQNGAWLDTLTTDQGTIELEDSDETDQKCIVKFSSNGETVGVYQFWIRVTDSTGRSSTPTKVSGVVAGSHTAAWLQYLDRTTTPATVTMLCPLTTASDISWTHALDGPGSATVTATAQEVRTRAQQLDTTVENILDTGHVELRITVGGTTVFVGPLSSTSIDSTGRNPLVTINASGLLSYTEGAMLAGAKTDPSGTTTFGLADQSQIVEELFSEGDFDTSHAMTSGVTGAGVSSVIEYSNLSTVGECLAELRNEPGSAEIWVDTERIIRAAQTRGSDKRSTTRLSSTLATSVERAAKSDEIVTACVVKSALGFSGYHEDPIQVARYGRLTRVVTADALTSNGSCTDLAREVVDRSKVRSEVVALSLYVTEAAPFTATDLEPGDVVTLAIEDAHLGNLVGAYRLVTTTVSVSSETPAGSFLVTVNAEPAVWDSDGRLQGSRSRLTAEFYSMAYEALYR